MTGVRDVSWSGLGWDGLDGSMSCDEVCRGEVCCGEVWCGEVWCGEDGWDWDRDRGLWDSVESSGLVCVAEDAASAAPLAAEEASMQREY